MDHVVPTTTRLAPAQVAPETFLIHGHVARVTSPLIVPVNALLIRGAEPVVVDTGPPEHRDRFLTDLFELVDPTDIRWVFVSHDDVDHTGNVEALLAAAPRALLVSDWLLHERMGAALGVPARRQRWIGDGEGFDAGDRQLFAIRPPVYDSPATRGLFDPTTGVYWSSDAFGTPTPAVVSDVRELDPAWWEDGMASFNHSISPWIATTEDRRFQATVDRVEALDPSVVVGCHTPVIRRADVVRAIDATRRSPEVSPAPSPDRQVLDALRRALAGPDADDDER